MQAIGAVTRSTRRLARVFRTASPSVFTSSERFHSTTTEDFGERRRSHSAAFFSGGNCIHGGSELIVNCSLLKRARLKNVTADEDTVKGVYGKMLNYVAENRTAPPNAWLGSLIAKCSTREDIELLFDILQKHRAFRLSNLRIPEGFNSPLCREVTKACVRTGALEFGMKTLWKHNLCGRTPDIGSAHHLLGILLECKPESAAAVIQVLYQTLSDARKSNIVVELQKLVSEWPLDVIKHQKENRQAFAETLQNDISVLINALSTLDVDVNVNMQEFPGNEAMLS